MPAAIYLRISQDRTGEAAGVGRQLKDCEALASRLGLDVIRVIDDNDVSAYGRKKRPGWEELVSLIESRAVDTVVTYHVDRLYRRTADLEALLTIVEGYGLKIHTVSAGDLDLSTSTGRMVAKMLGAAAAGEVERKAERQARQKLQVAEAGGFNGGRQPLGFHKDGVTIDESRAPALREAVARLLSKHSLASCARYVSDEWGVTVRPRVLRDALVAPRIAGLRQYWSAADRARWKADMGTRSDRPNGRDSGMRTMPATWEEIITVTEWTRVRGVLLNPDRTSGQSPRGRSLLGGLLTCTCERGMGYSRAAYKCMANAGGCGKVSCSTRGVESLITGLMDEVLDDTELPSAYVAESMSPERGRLQARYDELLPLWREGVISRGELTEQRTALQVEMARLDATESASVRRAVESEATLDALTRWHELGDDTTARATAIRAMFTGIRIHPAASGGASGPKFDTSRVRLQWRGSDAWVTVD